MDLRIGQTARFTRSFTQDDFDRFAALSGDDNPIHVDPGFAARTRFGGTVAHGMLLYGIICSVLENQMAGPGCVQIAQDLVFRNPAHTRTDITVQLAVTQLDAAEYLATIATMVSLPNGKPACEGHTVIRLPGWTGSEGRRHLRFDAPSPGTSQESALGRLALGQRASTRRKFARVDLAAYVELTGDTNPLFTDAAYARQMGFDDCIVPGPLLSGLFSKLLGTELPGRGTNWLKQHLVFPAVALVRNEIDATVEIVRLRPDKFLVNLNDECTDSAGKTVCRAESLVLVKDLE